MFCEKSEKILNLVKQDGNTIREHQETRNFLVKNIIRDISFKKQEMRYVERELKGLMSLLDFQLETMPGIDLVTASALIAEIIDDVRCFSNANKLARFAGIAPVYFGSGGDRKGTKKQAGKSNATHFVLQLSRTASTSGKGK